MPADSDCTKLSLGLHQASPMRAKGEQVKHTALWIGFLYYAQFDAKNPGVGQLNFRDSVLPNQRKDLKNASTENGQPSKPRCHETCLGSIK
jgi:hypothetical protein